MNTEELNALKEKALMIGDASSKPGQFSDSDKKTAENFGIDYMDVEEFVKVGKPDERHKHSNGDT